MNIAISTTKLKSEVDAAWVTPQLGQIRFMTVLLRNPSSGHVKLRHMPGSLQWHMASKPLHAPLKLPTLAIVKKDLKQHPKLVKDSASSLPILPLWKLK